VRLLFEYQERLHPVHSGACSFLCRKKLAIKAPSDEETASLRRVEGMSVGY